MPSILLAPSLAHEYDISRYNHVVNGTLLSTNDAIRYKRQGIYDWVWLDEWDTLDEHNKKKKFYTRETFDLLLQEGYKIALVTPELHASSPGLLGEESHSDAKNNTLLFERIRAIIKLMPRALCTDYPEEVCKMLKI